MPAPKHDVAQTDLTADELLYVIPMSSPMAHTITAFPGIARYPVDEWEQAQAPALTVKSLAQLATRVAAKDMGNLEGVFDAATQIDKHAREPCVC